jgi:glycolate oxidase
LPLCDRWWELFTSFPGLTLSRIGQSIGTSRFEPVAVVRPGSSDEVAAILKQCSGSGVPVVARGHGSSLTGGVTIAQGDVVLSLERLGEIEIDAPNACARVGAGALTSQLQARAAEVKLMYPPDPASAEFSTIGGNVATNAGGARGLKYGITADHVLGMVVALADGRVLRLGGRASRGAGGYRLLQLFIGSEGTLGVITEVTLKLLPLVTSRAAALVAYKNLAEVGEAVSALLRTGPLPCALEILDRAALTLVSDRLPSGLPRDAAAVLLVEQDGHDGELVISELASMLERLGGHENWVAQSEEERERLWAIVQSLPQAVKQASPVSLVGDVAVPPGRIADMLAKLQALAQREKLTIVTSGHAGDGCLHPRVLLGNEDGQRAGGLRSQILHDALELGGSISGEYGIGLLKRDVLRLGNDPEALDVMTQLKELFDPKGILNPGKLLPEC